MYNQKNHQFDSFYNHKFGFHISGPRQDAFDEVFRLRPKVVKTLDFSVDVMRRIKQEIPDVFLIGRLFVHPQDFGQLSGSTARDARRKGIEMAERILREEANQDRHHFNGQPLFNAWESLNEVFPEWSDDNTHKLFDEYQVAFGQKMLDAGFEPVAFNFGQGNGRGQQWLRLYPGTLEMYTYLGFHEYDWPTMDRLHRIGLEGPQEPQNLIMAMGEGRGNDGMWRCLRYRRIMYEGIRQKFGDKHTAIITECGMTQGVWGGPSRDIGPWAEELTVPQDIPGGVVDTPIPSQDYWQSLLWYNRELMKDDFVMGACLFVTGAAGLPEWETFEHLGIITDRIFAFQKLYDFDNLPSLVNPAIAPFHPITPSPEDVVSENDPPEIPEKDSKQDSIEEPIKDKEDADNLGSEAESTWRYTFETGTGLGLLVGDIGIAGERITIIRPDNQRLQVTSGSKGEYGPGGFEAYAQQPGSYQIEFLDQSFNLTLSGHFTRINFYKIEKDEKNENNEAVPSQPETENPIEESPPVEGILPILPPDGLSVTPEPPENPNPPSPPPTPAPTPPPASQTEWQYTFEIGSGLALLVGDIGIPDERVTIIKPDGRWQQIMSGSKAEHGLGGFEIYAQQPGNYQIEFLNQRFNLTLTGQFTRVIFRRNEPSVTPTAPAVDRPAAAPPVPSPDVTPVPQPAPPPVTDSPDSTDEDQDDDNPPPSSPQPDSPKSPLPSAPVVDKPPPTPPGARPISPPDESPQSAWNYRIERGQGLGLLVGDIGINGEAIVVTRPDGRQARLVSGSKPEYGLGGFELYAQQPGSYQIQFLDQKFELQLTGQFTKVVFERRSQEAQEVSMARAPAAVPSQPEALGSRGLFKVVMEFITRLFRRE